jgi:hypothetical protein
MVAYSRAGPFEPTKHFGRSQVALSARVFGDKHGISVRVLCLSDSDHAERLSP